MKPTVSEETTLSRDENDDEKLLGTLYGLVERCSHRLRRRSLTPRKAGLLFRYSDQEEEVRRISLPKASFWDFDLFGPIEKAFIKACQRRLRIRFLKVWFQDLFPPDPQLSLFPAVEPDPEKKAQVTRALDRIRGRYGDEVIQYARAA